MCTYEDLVAATLPYGLSPLVVPQLKTITLGGAVTGLGIESTSFRNGLPHESVLEMDILTGSRRGGHRIARRSTPTCIRAFPNSYGTLGYSVRLKIELEPVKPFVALRHLRFHSLQRPGRDDGPDHRDRRHRRHAGRLPRRRGVQRRRELPVPRHADRRRRARSATTPARTSTTARSSTTHGDEARPADHPRLPVALGHRLVLVLAGVRRAEPEDPAVLAAALPAQQLLLEADRLRPALRHRRPASRSATAARRANGSCRTSRCRSSGRAEFLDWFLDERADRADLAVPVAAARRRGGLAAVSDPARTTPTSTSASGRRCRSGPDGRAHRTG